METNPAKPAPPSDQKLPELGFDAKQRFITTLVESVFINVKSHDQAPDKYELDPRASSSELDDLIRLLYNERKVALKREKEQRAELKKEALNRNDVTDFINFGV